MPRIKVELIEGRTIEQKRLLAERVTQAAIEVFGVEPDAVTVRFEEVPAHNMAKAGRLRSDTGSSDVENPEVRPATAGVP